MILLPRTPTKLHSGVEDDSDDNEHCSNCDQEVIYRGAKHTQISFQISPPPLWCHPTSPAPLLILLHHQHQHHHHQQQQQHHHPSSEFAPMPPPSPTPQSSSSSDTSKAYTGDHIGDHLLFILARFGVSGKGWLALSLTTLVGQHDMQSSGYPPA